MDRSEVTELAKSTVGALPELVRQLQGVLEGVSFSAFIKTLLDDPDAATARATLGAVSSTVEGWLAASLENAWVNYSASYDPAGYYKDPWGRVHLRGLIKSGTSTGGTRLFTLPAGYRPPLAQMFPVTSNGLHGELEIQADGDVVLSSSVSNVYLSLSGISFRAA